MRRILITGGAGFVGTAMALALRSEAEVAVVSLDNLKRRGSERNVEQLRASGITFVHGDIRCPEDLRAAGDTDVIIECSAEPSVLAGYGGSPEYVVNTNLMGTLHCLEHARRCGAAVVFLSTSRVYPIAPLHRLAYTEGETRFQLAANQPMPGASERGIAEDFPLDGARSMYGATKLCSELMLLEYAEMYGIPAIVNRCGVLSGPGQMGKTDQGFVALWVARHLFGGPLAYIGFGGTGKQVRDVLHIDDLTALIRHELDHLESLAGETFNVGGGLERSVSLRELTDLCVEVTGTALPIGATPETRPADVPIYITDTRRVEAATGWSPKRRIEDVVGDTWTWLRDNTPALRPYFLG